MIQIHQLTFGYTKRNNLFDQLELTLEPGSIYGLLGKNGAGKTTFLKLIAGMLKPGSGSISIQGTDTKLRLPETLQDIYFIPEEFELPALTAQKFMEHTAVFYPKFNPEAYYNYLNQFGVDTSIPLNHLSFGQCKQVIISFGLATNTRYLLFDEPTNALDIPSKSILRKLLANAINDQRSFIISTHQVRDLEQMIDPIIILDQGKIIFNQTIDQITQNLTFTTLETLEDVQVIYSEPKFGGYRVICSNPDHKPSELNIELLFNGVIFHAEDLNRMFQS